MKLFRLGSMLVLGVALLSGCGPVEPEGTKVTVQSSAIVENLKKNLEEMTKSGKTGSGLTALESDINGIKASDSAKGEALHKDFMRLQLATKPEEVKAITKEMLGKL